SSPGLNTDERVVIDKAMHGRAIAADGTGAIAAVADFAECHRHGVVEQNPVDQPITGAGDLLDGLGRLDGADDARQCGQHADVLGLPDGSGRRWLGVEAAIAAAAREEDRDLALDPKDAAV